MSNAKTSSATAWCGKSMQCRLPSQANAHMARPTFSSFSINDLETTFQVEHSGRPAVALLGSGASHVFLSEECFTQCGMTISNIEETSVELGDGSIIAHIKLGETDSEDVYYIVPI